MNLYLHGIDSASSAVSIGDSLLKRPKPVDVVLTNPPFGKKSSFTIVAADGKKQPETISYQRNDFWATTSNKQLNFLQHVASMLKPAGRAAVVVPDNVLFEAGAGERIRRALLEECDVHTLLRLPTGIWYSAGVKANVLFFDKRRAAGKPNTKELWVYDLRTNRHFTLRHNPIIRETLGDFVRCYQPENRTKRVESACFRRFTYAELLTRDRLNLDISWIKDQSFEDRESQRSPDELTGEIIGNLESALKQFRKVEAEIKK